MIYIAVQVVHEVLADLKRHFKNWKCCPVSLLIVRSQWLSWIQVFNIMTCQQFHTILQAMSLSLSQKLLEAESKYFNILMLGLDFSRNWPFWNIHLSDWPGTNYFGPCQNYFYLPLLFDQAWTILVPFRAIFICLRFSKIVLEQNYVFHHHDIQSVNLLLTSDGHKSKKKTWLGENWQRYFFKSKLDGFRILIM